MPEVCKGWRKMWRLRIVATGRDAVIAEEGREVVRRGRPDRVQVPDVGRTVDRRRKAEVAHAFERSRVQAGRGPALVVPCVEVRELVA